MVSLSDEAAGGASGERHFYLEEPVPLGILVSEPRQKTSTTEARDTEKDSTAKVKTSTQTTRRKLRRTRTDEKAGMQD